MNPPSEITVVSELEPPLLSLEALDRGVVVVEFETGGLELGSVLERESDDMETSSGGREPSVRPLLLFLSKLSVLLREIVPPV